MGERDRARDRERQRELRLARRAAGLCVRCGKHPTSGDTQLCDTCRAYHQQRFQWEQAHPEWREKRREQLQQWTDNHREQARARSHRFVRNAREELLDHYGRVCACCGEEREPFLTFDFITHHPDAESPQPGAQSTAQPGAQSTAQPTAQQGRPQEATRRDFLLSVSGSRSLRNDLRSRGWPSEVQTMCWNCAAAKAYFGACPHVRQADR